MPSANGKDSLLKAESFQRLHTAPFGDGYGYGWFVAKDGSLSHSGSNGRFFAQISIIPRVDLAVLIATNQGGGTAAQACNELPSMLLARCNRN